MRQKRPANFRLTPEAIALLAALAKRRGISRAAVLELLIRSASESVLSVQDVQEASVHVRKEAKAERIPVSEGIEK